MSICSNHPSSLLCFAKYRPTNETWMKANGLYNLPVFDLDEEACAVCHGITQIVLYHEDEAKQLGVYKILRSKFLREISREELLQTGYPDNGKPHSDRYFLFSVKELVGDIAKNLKAISKQKQPSIVYLRDFVGNAARRKKIIAELANGNVQNGDFLVSLQKSLPDEVSQCSENVSFVSESNAQLSFLTTLFPPEFPMGKKAGISVISMFSGCGGMDLGFRGGFDFLGKRFANQGFDIVWANEINPAACKTYRQNFGHDIVEGDIVRTIDQMPKYADVIIGGFPCQDISINGKMAGIDGKRSCLYTSIVEAVRRIRPKVFVAENVGSLLMKKHEYSLAKILEDFKSLGYNVSYKLYNAADYGVPQTRERVFFVGTRKDMAAFVPPSPTTAENRPTAKAALQDLEMRPQDKEFSHIWSKAVPSGEQGNRRLVADRPGYTMRSECHGNIQFHYSLPRRISMREAARIQSFPDTFLFPCGIRETERQIGNAVPPVLAWHIAKAVRKAIRGGAK